MNVQSNLNQQASWAHLYYSSLATAALMPAAVACQEGLQPILRSQVHVN